jgi:hypothetical protein
MREDKYLFCVIFHAVGIYFFRVHVIWLLLSTLLYSFVLFVIVSRFKSLCSGSTSLHSQKLSDTPEYQQAFFGLSC